MKRLFGGLNMSWPAVLLFAAAAGVYTGAVMLVDALKDTSFQDIGISYEWWVIFAVVIVVNCGKSWEAALKCFAFFFISQPLVFAVEVVFGHLAADMALYYYRHWLPMIVLTLPGGFIAYYCKRQGALGALILGLGNTIQAVYGVYYLAQAAGDLPHHLLSSAVCFGSILLMSRELQREWRRRALALLVPLALTAALIAAGRLSVAPLF